MVLYELLTGHGPYRLATLAPLEVMRAVVEQEPEPPSAVIDRTVRLASAEGRPAVRLTPGSVSRTREGTPERLRHKLRGDLDAILMTALRKEPERRYPSVEAFAEDMRPYLSRPSGERAARQPALPGGRSGWGGTVGRRWRRRSSRCLGALAARTPSCQSRRVARERDRAERVSSFLVDLFSVSDPGRPAATA